MTESVENEIRKLLEASESAAEFIRGMAVHLFDYSEGAEKSLDAADRAVAKALNEFCVAEKQPSIDVDAIKVIPNNAIKQLRYYLDSSYIDMTPNAFNTSKDARERGLSSERQQNLANLYSALHRYIDEKRGGQASSALSMRLWRKDTEGGAPSEENTIDFNNEKVILLLPGMTSMHSKLSQIQKYWRDIEVLLGPRDEKIQLYSLTYPSEGRMALHADTHQTNAAPNSHAKPQVREFVEQTLLPSLGVHEGDAPLSPVQLTSKLRKLNMYTISYGSCIALQIRNAMAEQLLGFGYDAATIKQAMKSVFCQNVNPACRIDQEPPETGNFTGIYVVSPHDITSRSRANYEDLVPEGEAPPTLVKNVRPNTHLLWRESPLAGLNLRTMTQAKPEDAHLPVSFPTNKHPLLGHDHEASTHDVAEPLAHGAVRHHYAAPLANPLRRAVDGAEIPEDIGEAFEPYHLDHPEKLEQARHAKRTEKGLGRDC
jgi:hypothetical protein